VVILQLSPREEFFYLFATRPVPGNVKDISSMFLKLVPQVRKNAVAVDEQRSKKSRIVHSIKGELVILLKVSALSYLTSNVPNCERVQWV
jgi:hypothetical protein